MNGDKSQQPRAYGTGRAATLLDTTPDVLRYHIRQGHIRAVRIGERLLVPADEIDRLLTAQAEPQRQEAGAV